MFKKSGKYTFETQPQSTESPSDFANRPSHPFTSDLMNAIQPSSSEEPFEEPIDREEPETVIASGVSISGTLAFEKFLKIDGSFKGEIISSGKLIIGPTGSVQADLQLEEVFISGKIKGNITAKKRVVLRGRAEVEGDITAPFLSVDEGVCILGRLRITQKEEIQDAFDAEPYFSDN